MQIFFFCVKRQAKINFLKDVDSTVGFSLPRDKGGVSILWPIAWRSNTKRLDNGNERIVATELLSDVKMCLVSVYLTSNNPSADSQTEYRCLDILHDILMKYRSSHKVFIAGEFNGTLLQPRPYNIHDLLLNNFVKEHDLDYFKSDKNTFFHHSGSFSSQIDYILTTDHKILQTTKLLIRDFQIHLAIIIYQPVLT